MHYLRSQNYARGYLSCEHHSDQHVWIGRYDIVIFTEESQSGHISLSSWFGLLIKLAEWFLDEYSFQC